MSEPTSPGTREFYDAVSVPELGDPATDPPLTVRVESWERRFDPAARRVVRVAEDPGWPRPPWCLVTGHVRHGEWLPHAAVAAWPIAPPLTYTTAYRHEQHRRRAAGALAGDLGEEAFRGER